MKILEINTEKTWRGGERQTFYLLRGLHAAGMEVELLCRRGTQLERRAQALGVPVHGVAGHAQALLFLARSGRGYGLLHAQSAKAHSMAAASKIFHRRPVVATRRVMFDPRGWLWPRLRMRATDYLVGLTEGICAHMRGRGALRTAVIPSAVEETPCQAARVERFRSQIGAAGLRVAATMGAFDPSKDPETMLRAVEELRRLRGDDFVFVHFGDGPLRPGIEAQIRARGLSAVYRTPGFVENVEDFFAMIDVFVMSSRIEGIGSNVLDAFLRGVPVVSTGGGALAETVAGRGLLCPVGDWKGLAACIDRMLRDPAVRDPLVREAREYARTRCSIEGVTRQYLDLFGELLGTPKAGAA